MKEPNTEILSETINKSATAGSTARISENEQSMLDCSLDWKGGWGNGGGDGGVCSSSSSKGLGYSKNISPAANQRETGSSSRDVCCC